MNINRDYLIINDVKKSNIKLDNGSMFFYITDKNTQNIFVNLVINISNNDLIQKYANIENAEDYTLTMNIVKPDNTHKIIEGKLHDKEKAIFEFDLNEDCCDEIGTYRCELLTKCNINNHEEITTSNKLTYKVKSSVLNDLDDIVEAPEYPLVIQLFDKLSDIEQYEEDRRAAELARQLAEEQRQTRFNTLDADMVDRVNAMDSKMDDVEARISAKEQAVDKLIVDTKVDIDDYKVAKDTEIDEYKTAKDTEINQAITNQDNKIDEAIADQNNKIDDAIANQNNKIDTAVVEQNNRIEIVEASDNTQNTRLDALEAKDIAHETSITNIEAKNVEQDNRLDSIEAVNVSRDNRLDAIEIKNQQQDDRLLNTEKINKRQDMDLKCLFAESKNNMIDVTEEGNSVYLQNSTVGYTLIDEIQGNTMVNCNKEPNKELILNGNINTNGYSNVTLTEGVDGGLVDIALEGNTMVNVCDQKDPVAITKSYTVETGNHVALQGEYDGKCRPVVTGNTLVNLASNSNLWQVGCSGDENTDYTITSTDTQGIVIDKLNDSTRYLYLRKQIDPNLFKPNTTYTIIFNSLKGSDVGIVSGNTAEIVLPLTSCNDGYNIITVTSTDLSTITGTSNIYVYLMIHKTYIGTAKASDFIVLEGDYTNKPIPGYFEGLQSSFEDKVVTQEMVDAGEELAENLGKYRVDYVVTGKNKFDINTQIENIALNSSTGLTYVRDNRNTSDFIPIQPNTTYMLNGGAFAGRCFYDKNKNYISYFTSAPITSPSNAYYMRIAYDNTQSFDTMQLEEGAKASAYEPYKEYKKTFYLNSPLLEGDTIEQQGNNVVHVHRYSEPGTVTDIKHNAGIEADLTDCYAIYVVHSNKFVSNSQRELVICNKLPHDITNGDYPHVRSDGGTPFSTSTIIFVKRAEVDAYASLTEWFENSGINFVGALATPQYEVISQNDTILCDSYVNGHLDVDSVVPIERVDFLSFEKDLTYLYANTQYTVQFTSDKAVTVDITLGGTKLLAQSIVKGLNRIAITTPSELVDNKLVIDGVGANIKEVVVTNSDREFGYFEGMKSVGECEDLEVVSSNSDSTLSNTQTLTHEPLRGVGDIKDKYVLIDGKWYIERNCGEVILDGSENWSGGGNGYFYIDRHDMKRYENSYTECIICDNKPVFDDDGTQDNFITGYGKTDYPGQNWIYFINRTKASTNELKLYLQSNPTTVIYQLASPTYEPIDYDPFTVYSDTTHISNNSTIPCNMTIKNTGFNCLLKPSTTYTVSSNLGLNVVTTPSVLTEDCLRFYDTDTSTVTTMKNVTILEGDYTTGKPIPSHFSGIESAFEQEYDEEKGKYKVTIKVVGKNLLNQNLGVINSGYGGAKTICFPVKPNTTYIYTSSKYKGSVAINEISEFIPYDTSSSDIENYLIKLNDISSNRHFTTSSRTKYIFMNYDKDSNIQIEEGTEATPYEPYKENNITFYINEPLRGIGDVKDKVYVKNDKVVVERNCGQREYQDGDFGTYLTDKVNTVYQLAEPTYEEVEYNDVKLFIESFKNSTLFYNSNIPVTSKLWYSYSIPLVDKVAQTASITDEQDSMIIDLATQCAVMEMMLM